MTKPTFPTIRVPAIDPKTGLWNQEWYSYLERLDDFINTNLPATTEPVQETE